MRALKGPKTWLVHACTQSIALVLVVASAALGIQLAQSGHQATRRGTCCDWLAVVRCALVSRHRWFVATSILPEVPPTQFYRRGTRLVCSLNDHTCNYQRWSGPGACRWSRSWYLRSIRSCYCHNMDMLGRLYSHEHEA
ncbi:hypothetical protein D0867_05004 [Hortaea werneckii]|uniref:Uncharacterized protein n=1 Tax=Hortaea werneckii TaxID=91943 RepID=A0A3M6ZUN9_HORWE|nr:hypothetical protein D0867_05004 [Hortaea werneckii]